MLMLMMMLFDVMYDDAYDANLLRTRTLLRT
jgi:hypothetical protein